MIHSFSLPYDEDCVREGKLKGANLTNFAKVIRNSPKTAEGPLAKIANTAKITNSTNN